MEGVLCLPSSTRSPNQEALRLPLSLSLSNSSPEAKKHQQTTSTSQDEPKSSANTADSQTGQNPATSQERGVALACRMVAGLEAETLDRGTNKQLERCSRFSNIRKRQRPAAERATASSLSPSLSLFLSRSLTRTGLSQAPEGGLAGRDETLGEFYQSFSPSFCLSVCWAFPICHFSSLKPVSGPCLFD